MGQRLSKVVEYDIGRQNYTNLGGRKPLFGHGHIYTTKCKIDS